MFEPKNPNINVPYAQLVSELENFFNLLLNPLHFIPKIDEPQSNQNSQGMTDEEIAINNKRLNESLEQKSEFFRTLMGNFAVMISSSFEATKNRENGNILYRMGKIKGLESFLDFKEIKNLDAEKLEKAINKLETVISEKIAISLKIKEIGTAINEKNQSDFEKIINEEVKIAKMSADSLSDPSRALFEKCLDLTKNSLITNPELICEKNEPFVDLSSETLTSINNKVNFLKEEKKQMALLFLKKIKLYNKKKSHLIKIIPEKNIEASNILQNNEETQGFTPLSDIALPAKTIQETMEEINDLESKRFALSGIENIHLEPLQGAAELLKNIGGIITEIITNEKNLRFIPDSLVFELQKNHGEAVSTFNRSKKKFEDEKENVTHKEEKEKTNLRLQINEQEQLISEYIKNFNEQLNVFISKEENRLDSKNDDQTKNYITQLTKAIQNLTDFSKKIPDMEKNSGENLHFIRKAINFIIEFFSNLKEEIKKFIDLWTEEHTKLENEKLKEVHDKINQFQGKINNFEITLNQLETLLKDPDYAISNTDTIKVDLISFRRDLEAVKNTTTDLLKDKNLSSGDKNKQLIAQKEALKKINTRYTEAAANYERENLKAVHAKINQFQGNINNFEITLNKQEALLNDPRYAISSTDKIASDFTSFRAGLETVKNATVELLNNKNILSGDKNKQLIVQEEELENINTRYTEAVENYERENLKEVHDKINQFQGKINNFETTLNQLETLLNESRYATLDNTVEIQFNLTFFRKALETLKGAISVLLNDTPFSAGEINKQLTDHAENLINIKSICNEALLKYETENLLLKITQRIKELNIASTDSSLVKLYKKAPAFIKALEPIQKSLEDAAQKNLLERKKCLDDCKEKYNPIAKMAHELYIESLSSTSKTGFFNFSSIKQFVLGSQNNLQSSSLTKNNNNNG